MGVDRYDDANSSWDSRKTLDETQVPKIHMAMKASGITHERSPRACSDPVHTPSHISNLGRFG